MALTALSALLLALYGHARAATDQAYWEQQAAAVKTACSNSDFYGEAYFVGARVLSTQVADTVEACCTGCKANLDCFIWTYCTLPYSSECPVPTGPFANRTVPAGTCIHSSGLNTNPRVDLSWIYWQPGEVWASGLKTSPQAVQIIPTSLGSQQHRAVISEMDKRLYCRKVTGGNLQLTALTGILFPEQTVAVGDKVIYTGLIVEDEQSDEWGILFSNATKSFVRYPAAYLGPCEDSDSVCTPGTPGGHNEEGTSCHDDEDCCSGMRCSPRVSIMPGTLPMATVVAFRNFTDASQSIASDFSIGSNSTDGLSVLLGECTPLGREFISTNWPSKPFDASEPGYRPIVTCRQRFDGFRWGEDGTWNASAPTIFPDSGLVPWETWAAELCSNLSTAGPLLAESVKKGGVDAARAYNATTYSCGSDKPQLLEVFYNFVNPPFTGQWDSVAEYAAAYVAAGDSTGAAVCVTLAAETGNGTVLRQLQFHTPVNKSNPEPTPAPTPPPAPVPGPEPSSSNTGVIVAVVVSVVAACAVGALVAFYIVRRHRRQRLADGKVKGFISAHQAMGDGELNTPSGTLTSVTASRTSAAARTGSGQVGSPSTGSRDYVLSAIASAQSRGGAQPSGRSSLVGTHLSPRRGSSGLDARPWEIGFEELQIIRAVGEGSYGKVYLGSWHETAVAIKILLGSSIVTSVQEAEEALEAASKMVGQLDSEAGLMASLRHPNCVPFFAVCHNPPCIVTEYCSHGGLDAVLAQARRDPGAAAQLTWKRRLLLVLDAARGMLYLHHRSVPVLHRDLKSPNILVDENWRAKVADFNLARIMEDPSRSSSLAAMNPRWLAPEVMQGAHADKASDVYSFGIVMWEVLTLQLPFAGGMLGPWQIVSFIINGGRPEVPSREQLPGSDTPQFEGLPTYINLMQRCWAQDAQTRPDFATIVAELKTLLTSHLSSSDGLARPTYRHLLSEDPSGEAELRTSGGSSTSAPATAARGSGNSASQHSSAAAASTQ